MNKLELDIINSTLTPSKYNDEKVYYCRNCLSLAIRTVAGLEDACFCDSCGTTDIECCSIEEWEEKYKQKFGHKYLEEY